MKKVAIENIKPQVNEPVAPIIAKVPDAEDKKRRKIEKEREEEEMKKSKERADASYEKAKQEIKALEQKQAAINEKKQRKQKLDLTNSNNQLKKPEINSMCKA